MAKMRRQQQQSSRSSSCGGGGDSGDWRQSLCLILLEKQTAIIQQTMISLRCYGKFSRLLGQLDFVYKFMLSLNFSPHSCNGGGELAKSCSVAVAKSSHSKHLPLKYRATECAVLFHYLSAFCRFGKQMDAAFIHHPE
jgi:hypothetical protein